MKSGINTILLLLVGTVAFAQKISGHISEKNKPVAGVNVTLKNTVRGVQTDANGKYEIAGMSSGTYTVVVSMIGYERIEKAIELQEASVTLDITLQEATYNLRDIEVTAARGVTGTERLGEVDGYGVYAGKKTEVINLKNIDANLAMNNPRQVFGRVPGISVWENDGSGIQLGIASRGLSPNRSWEFNTRMNGYDISSDPMGYPEAYYTPPMEVVDRIEVVRGASSLQYGPQFGGLLNFVLRKPDISKKFTVESQQTVGSNGLFTSFNYVGGTVGRLNYTAYYQRRQGDGWRKNSQFYSDHAHLQLDYAITNKWKIGAELTYMNYLSQQAGGLTDAQFAADARQSNRSRNWFSAPWFIPVITSDWVISEKTKLSLKAFGTIAQRNSIGFVSAITITDNNGNRQIDRDFYNNFGSEARLLTEYRLFGKSQTLAAGVRYFNGNTIRQQQGIGNNESGYSLALLNGSAFPRDLDYRNINTSVFVENVFRVSKRLLFTAGLRYENIASDGAGQMGITNGQAIQQPYIARTRSFILAGVGVEFHPTATTEFYGNLSQAYRPVLFSDLLPPATTDVIDANLRDANGYNFDFGYRGRVGKWLNFDVSTFRVNYNNRIGTVTRENTDRTRFQFRTNLGQSVSSGVESYIEASPTTALGMGKRWGKVTMFASLAWVNARYVRFATTSVVNGAIVEGSLAGKRVENAPKHIHRYGISYSKKGFSATWQRSDIAEAFADASNTTTPNAAATTGLIPGYAVQDFSLSYTFLRNYNLKAGANNLTDARYFTRRSGGYPGPGILPADGRTFYFSAGIKF